MPTAMDVEALRRDFPILERRVYGRPLVYLDNTATSQTPHCVVEAIERMYFEHKANVHRGVFSISQEATDLMEASRERVRQYINAPSTREVIFTRGTTEAINLVAASYGSLLHDDDEIILTVMEHHANIVPWQLLQRYRRVKLRVVPIHADGSLDMEVYRSLFTDRTRIVSVAHVSNVLGTVNPIAEIARIAHDHGAVVMVDGAQAAPHMAIDVQALGADFYVFSSHKMYGPAGVGVLYGREELLERMPPYQGGGEMIEKVTFAHTTFAELPLKFEAGTPDFVDIAALPVALDYIERIGINVIATHERQLMEWTQRQMMEIEGMRIFGTTPGKCAVISFIMGHAHPYDTGMLLDKLGIAVRTGHHCAEPLMDYLGVPGTVRASFALYNTQAEAQAFIDALHRIAPMLN